LHQIGKHLISLVADEAFPKKAGTGFPAHRREVKKISNEVTVSGTRQSKDWSAFPPIESFLIDEFNAG